MAVREILLPGDPELMKCVRRCCAKLLQHECDHLDGQVYLDRMADMKSLTFIKEFEAHVLRDEDET